LGSRDGYFQSWFLPWGVSAKKILIPRKWSREGQHSTKKWSRATPCYSRKWCYATHFWHFLYSIFWTLSRCCHL
jgi:hypothetical protein